MTHKSGDVGCDLRRPGSPSRRVDTHAKFHSRKCHVRLNVSNNIPGRDRNREASFYNIRTTRFCSQFLIQLKDLLLNIMKY